MGHSVPKVSGRVRSSMTDSYRLLSQLNDPSLFKQQAFINGKWVDAKSGQTFDVYGTTRQETSKPPY